MQVRTITGIGLALLIPVIITMAWLAWQWQALAPPVQSTMRVLVFGIPIAAAAAGAYVLIAGAWRRLVDWRSIEAGQRASLARAERALPDNLTNLSYSFHDSRSTLPAPDLEIRTLPELPPPTAPSFAHLLDAGKIGPGQPLCLGYDETGHAITGSWNDLYSCGVGGMTGSGKSWAVAFLAGQSAAAGARIILIDPHAGDPESLSNRLGGLSGSYMCDVASTPSEIESALKLASRILEGRKTGRGAGWPLLLICDEWTSMLRGQLGDLLTATALDIAEQGRKFGVFALLAAQAWQIAAAGAVRDRLASHYVLRTRGDQFRYQTGLRTAGAPADTLTLQAGQAYMLSVRGDLSKITIPMMTPADITRLGLLIDKPAAAALPAFGFRPSALPPTQPLTPTAEINGNSRGNHMEIKTELISSAPQSAKMVSPEAAHAAMLFLAGKDIPEIIRELRGELKGRAYQTANAEIHNLIREGMQQ